MYRCLAPILVVLAGIVLFASASSLPGEDDKEPGNRSREVIYIPSPQPVVDKMLELAGIKNGDVVYDLGCGDGRIVVTAAKKYKTQAVGYEIDPAVVAKARDNVRRNKVQKLVTIQQAEIFTLDLSEATVICLYLSPKYNEKLMPQLAKLKPGSRIVSHDFPMRGAKPKKIVRLKAKGERGEEREHVLYLWVVPWEKE
jgi:tRNA G37 N-methylase Trm5